MNKTIQIITTLLLTFVVPLFTSLLLDWPWVENAWPRYALIVLLMLVEMAIGAYIFKEVVALEQVKKTEEE